MSDCNVLIKEVDSAMDMLEAFVKDIDNAFAYASFDIASVTALAGKNVNFFRHKAAEGGDTELFAAEDKLCKLISIKSSCDEYGAELTEQLCNLCSSAKELAKAALHEMGLYISKLNRIGGIGQTYSSGPSKSDFAFVCVVDSKRYPQTAEHILAAQKAGFSSVLTIGRDSAAERRRESLKNVRTNSFFDRDEYPCAVFTEGGAGADVVYIEGSDNRGAGSFMRWQMRNMPDGSSVRIRVI